MAKKYTEDQLNTLDKSFLVQMYLNLQEQLESLMKETHELNEKMLLMMEQLILNKQARFGRSSEKMTDAGQICSKEVDGNILFFNEAEAISNMAIPEPEDLEVKPTRGVKPAGRKEGHISGLPVNRVDHYLSAGQLTLEFGEEGWKQLPDAVMKHYRFVPAKVEVDEHHIGVYSVSAKILGGSSYGRE